MCANSAKATFLVSSDCTGSGRFHILVLGECFDHLLSAVTVNFKAPAEPGHPLLCLSVAAFKVHFMFLSRYLETLYSIARQPSPSPFQVLLYILGFFFCLCVRGCIKACKTACSRCANILEHVYMCALYIVRFAYYMWDLVLRLVCLQSKMCLCLFVSIYIRADSEHRVSKREASRAHLQPTVLPCCLSAER